MYCTYFGNFRFILVMLTLVSFFGRYSRRNYIPRFSCVCFLTCPLLSCFRDSYVSSSWSWGLKTRGIRNCRRLEEMRCLHTREVCHIYNYIGAFCLSTLPVVKAGILSSYLGIKLFIDRFRSKSSVPPPRCFSCLYRAFLTGFRLEPGSIATYYVSKAFFSPL